MDANIRIKKKITIFVRNINIEKVEKEYII